MDSERHADPEESRRSLDERAGLIAFKQFVQLFLSQLGLDCFLSVPGQFPKLSHPNGNLLGFPESKGVRLWACEETNAKA